MEVVGAGPIVMPGLGSAMWRSVGYLSGVYGHDFIFDFMLYACSYAGRC